MEIITTHKNMDFDALASAFASSVLYPDASVMLPSSKNPNVRAFLSMHKGHFSFISPKDIDPGNITKLVVVDTNVWARVEGIGDFKKMNNPEIIGVQQRPLIL